MADIINLNEYRELKSTDEFEKKYQKLLHVIGTPRTLPDMFMNFYCFLRHMEGMINAITVLDANNMLDKNELKDFKEQMVYNLEDIILVIKGECR